MNPRCCWLLLLVSGTLLLLLGCQHSSAPQGTSAENSSPPSVSSAPPQSSPPQQSPSSGSNQAQVRIQYLDYQGLQRLIASHRGKVVVVDYWSTFCGPCMKEFPHLVELSRKYAEQVACISVSLDYDGTGKPEEVEPGVREFLEKQQATFDNVIFAQDPEKHLYPHLGAAAIPVVQVYDRQGRLVRTFNNDNAEKEEDYFTYEDVEALVKQLLQKP